MKNDRHSRNAAAIVIAIVIVAAFGCASVGRDTSETGSTSNDGIVAFLRFDGLFWQVWTMAANGNQQTQASKSAYEKARISWYPDGQSILISALDGRVLRLDLESGRETELPFPIAFGRDAVLSPNGRNIAVSLNFGDVIDTNEIFVVSIDGKRQDRLLSLQQFQHEPQWSYDGEWIYFHSFARANEDHDIWRVRLDGSRLEQLTTGQDYNLDVSISKDGTLAFSSNRTGDYEIWTWALDEGRSPAQNTFSPGLDGRPSWSPDGNELVFQSSRSGSLQIWRKPDGKSTATRLTNDAQPSREPVWWIPRSEVGK